MEEDNNEQQSSSNLVTDMAKDAAKKKIEEQVKKKLITMLPTIGIILFWLLVIILILVILLGGGMALSDFLDGYFEEKEEKAAEKYYTELQTVMKDMYSKYGVKINPNLITETQFFSVNISAIEFSDEEIDDDKEISDEDIENNAVTFRQVSIKDIRKLAVAQIIKTSTISSKYTCYTTVNKTVGDVEQNVQENLKTYIVGVYEISTPYNEFKESDLDKTLTQNSAGAIEKSAGEYTNISSVAEAKKQYEIDYPNASNITCNDNTSTTSKYRLSSEKFSHYLRTNYLVNWKRDQNYGLENLPNVPYCKKIGESIEAINKCIEEEEDVLIANLKTNSVNEIESLIDFIVEKAQATFDEADYDYGSSSSNLNYTCTGGLQNSDPKYLEPNLKPIATVDYSSVKIYPIEDVPDFALQNLHAPINQPYRIDSSVGYRFECVSGCSAYHHGIDLNDIANSTDPVSQPVNIYAVSSGEVVSVGGSYGVIEIKVTNPDNPEEAVYHRYVHMHSSNVSVGQNVVAGDFIGVMGAKGASNVHLHFEVRGSTGTTGTLYNAHQVINAASNCVPGLDNSPDYSDYIIANNEDAAAASLELQSNGFPENYANRLAVLLMDYPNFVFKPYMVDVTLESAKNSLLTKKTMQNHVGDWIPVTEDLVLYYVNPLNFLKIESIFQFQDLSYIEANAGAYRNQITSMLLGRTYGTDEYVNYFMVAGRDANIDPISLAAKAIQETSLSGSASAINGNSGCASGNGYYNFYNIGAADELGLCGGLTYASGNGSYLRPWNTREKAIKGGALWIASDYLQAGQSTKYFQMFDFIGEKYTHQYATNVRAAYDESITMYNAIKKSGSLQTMDYYFLIPVFLEN